MNLKKIGKVFTSKFVGTGPSSYNKRIYRAAVSQRLRNTGLVDTVNRPRAGRPKNRGSIAARYKKFIVFPQRPDRPT